MILKLERGLRVGIAIDYNRCSVVDLIDVYRFGNVPILVEYVGSMSHTIRNLHPVFFALYPSETSVEDARAFPPFTENDTRYQVITLNELRTVPDPRNSADYAPFGPYQHPGEKRDDFITRLREKEAKIARGQTEESSQRREHRRQRAKTYAIPNPKTPVYMWMKVGDVFPYAPNRHQALDYRQQVPPSVVPLVWTTHPHDHKYYAAVFNTWDLWVDHDGQPQSSYEAVLRSILCAPDSTNNELQLQYEEVDTVPPPEDNYARPTADMLVDAAIYLANHYQCNFATGRWGYTQQFFMYSPYLWYGIYGNTGARDPVECRDVTVAFGESPQSMDRHVDYEKNTMAGWLDAFKARNMDAIPMRLFWDLSKWSSLYLGNSKRLEITIRRRSAATARPPYVQRTSYFEIAYAEDPADQNWKLVTSASAVTLLICHKDIVTSEQAIRKLVLLAVPFHTVSNATRQPTRQLNKTDYCSFVRWREPEGDQYNEYMLRLLDIMQQPHMRAAFTIGGIVTRLMLDAVHTTGGELLNMWLDLVVRGPSEDIDKHNVIVEGDNGELGVDDTLSEDDCLVICGAYKLLTGSSVIPLP